MCFYFFVDSGTSRLETWVLAPRLILPVVAFLLIGYAHLLAGLVRRLRLPAGIVGGSLILVTALLAFGVSWRHHRWQLPMGHALTAARQLAEQAGTRELGVLPQAMKVGVLFPGVARQLDPSNVASPLVVLCSDHAASYRAGHLEKPFSCARPGYRSAYREGGFEVLTRDEGGASDIVGPP
jgi:hypothetical protein